MSTLVESSNDWDLPPFIENNNFNLSFYIIAK